MQIKSLYLAHFGRFHRKNLELKPGMNVIYGENEAGKSTVHAFISAMLFGAERLRGKASKNDGYSRYQPWEDGKNYEGSMEMEHRGHSYRLTRNFYREDEYFRVEQLDTGREIRLPGNQIDALVDGLNKANFKNSLSISQMEARIDPAFGLNLQAFMANVERTKSQAVDLGRTLDYLKKEKKKHQNTDAEKQLARLTEQSGATMVSEAEYEQLLQDIKKRQEMLLKVQEEIQNHSREDKEKRQKEQAERMEAVRMIEENNRIATAYQKKKAEYEKLKEKVAEADFDELKERWSQAHEDYEELADALGQVKGRNLAILFSVLMFGLFPVVAVFFLTESMMYRMAVCGGLAVIIMGLMLVLGSGKKRMERKVNEARDEYQELQKQMEYIMFGRGNQTTLMQVKEDLKFLRERYEELQEPLKPYIEKYGEDISLNVDGDEEAEAVIEFLRDKESHMLKSLERLLVQKEMLEQQAMDLEDLEIRMADLTLEVKDHQEKADVIQECMQMIQELSEEIHSDFGPQLNREVSKLMWELTGGKYSRVTVDNELGLKVDVGSRFVMADQLSTGAREQLYLALRLAMINLLYPDKKMPILLDDSFVCYDDQRLARVLSWLTGQGYEQILLFTCQHREMDILDQMDISYHGIFL